MKVSRAVTTGGVEKRVIRYRALRPPTSGRPIVLELQEKVGGVQMSVGLPVSKVASAASDHVSGDAVSALLTLGYKRAEAEKAVQQVRADATDTVTVEVLLKDALKQLGR